jgi:hypothetical protein
MEFLVRLVRIPNNLLIIWSFVFYIMTFFIVVLFTVAFCIRFLNDIQKSLYNTNVKQLSLFKLGVCTLTNLLERIEYILDLFSTVAFQ